MELIEQFSDIIKSAPAYGWCGIVVTFHDGRATKIEKNIGISIKPESREDGI
jgi:hypothetical protein